MARLLEVCVDSAASLAAAVAGGADRIELCSALELGGLTPTAGLMQQAAKLKIPTYAMVRPRGGDFVFSEGDVAVMLGDIDAIRAAGLAGVVLGASHVDGTLDGAVLGRLTRYAQGLGRTLHRAVDLVPDLAAAVETAVAHGFERILTSGGAATAIEGLEGLQNAIQAARGRISIMPGSGVTAANVERIIAATGAFEVHATCSVSRAGMGGKVVDLGFAGPTRRATSADVVAGLKAALNA
ncbi:copper homeostasis protein CutC [Devosia sp.]|uniref:copper homeostasis protein CutC n=1 Tax=Devosia sp. TaxID=1871048 RepID=UPI0032665C36